MRIVVYLFHIKSVNRNEINQSFQFWGKNLTAEIRAFNIKLSLKETEHVKNELIIAGSFEILNQNSQTLGGFWKRVTHEFKWKLISSRTSHFIRIDSRGQNANHTLRLCPLSKINSLLRYQQVE